MTDDYRPSTLDPRQAASGNLQLWLKRVGYLGHLLEVCGADKDNKPRKAPIWETWLKTSGELPPDFDALPSNAFLPDVRQCDDGSRVQTPADWQRRREEVLALLQYYQLGHWPPPPSKMVAEELGALSEETVPGAVRQMRLVFGPDAQAVVRDTLNLRKDLSTFKTVRLGVEVFIPPGTGPFPAIVEVGARQGARIVGHLSDAARARGYVVCLFDRMDAFSAKDVYTDYDCNELVWWAYAASRCIDYLVGLDEVDASRIAVTGHSRGGKMAVIAAALDTRVTAAIASHTGTGSGGVPPWRYAGEKFGAETLESSTRSFPYWNHPRLRFFAGRENKLPFDSHFLLALAAPRALLLTEGDADHVGEPWGAHQAYLATREIYELLGHPDNLNLYYTRGGHQLAPEVLDGYVDWLDMQFGRRPRISVDQFMYTYTFNGWRQVTGQHVDVTTFPERGQDDLLTSTAGIPIRSAEDWQDQREAIRERLLWLLGELPLLAETYEATPTAPQETGDGLTYARLPITDTLTAHLTFPTDGTDKLPVAIYLHAYLDAKGHDWSRSYGWGTSVGERLARKGFLAVEFDQFGYGTRNHDCGLDFYAQHPRQSAMGVMVQDVRKVVRAVAGLSLADPDRIMVAGFSLGGAVGLFAAALEPRIRAVASTCGFGAMRLDAHGNETEGLRRYSHLRPTLPRLGFFIGQEARVPCDFPEILALIAPRPVLAVTPLLDQDWRFEDVEACVAAARRVYALLGAPDRIECWAPHDFNRYPPKYQNRVNDWLWRLAQQS